MARRVPRRLERSPANREPRSTFVIYCEGKNTEPAYLNALKRLYSRVILQIYPAAGVPQTQARDAVVHARASGLQAETRAMINSFEENDQVWVVFDRDDHPRFDEAVNLCESKGIKVARSNPCFEVWLVLHIEDFHRPDGRQAVQAHLRKLRPDYDPGRRKVVDCDELIACLLIAEERAEAQLKQREREGAKFGCPSTTFFKLTRAIRQASEQAA